MPYLGYILTALAAYLLGSIPTGYLAARAKGIDIRTVGSGNIGATNAMRVLGKPTGILVLAVDALKGFAAVTLMVNFFPELNSTFPGIFGTLDNNSDRVLRSQLGVIAGIGVVLGHNYTCWLRFKGGKGIATTAGVYIALAWPAVLVALIVFVLAVSLTRYVSVGSIAAAAALSIAVWLGSGDLLLDLVTTALSALAIYKHRTNIQRLRDGTESRLNFTRKETPK